MLTVKYTFYWNRLCISSQVSHHETRKFQQPMALPHGGRMLLTVLPSEVIKPMRPFGLQEDHIAREGGTCEAVMFFHKGWETCHLTLVAHHKMVFVACSHRPVELEDLAADYATNMHTLAEYIPLLYAA